VVVSYLKGTLLWLNLTPCELFLISFFKGDGQSKKWVILRSSSLASLTREENTRKVAHDVTLT
jgi:hypothetical protein